MYPQIYLLIILIPTLGSADNAQQSISLVNTFLPFSPLEPQRSSSNVCENETLSPCLHSKPLRWMEEIHELECLRQRTGTFGLNSVAEDSEEVWTETKGNCEPRDCSRHVLRSCAKKIVKKITEIYNSSFNETSCDLILNWKIDWWAKILWTEWYLNKFPSVRKILLDARQYRCHVFSHFTESLSCSDRVDFLFTLYKAMERKDMEDSYDYFFLSAYSHRCRHINSPTMKELSRLLTPRMTSFVERVVKRIRYGKEYASDDDPWSRRYGDEVYGHLDHFLEPIVNSSLSSCSLNPLERLTDFILESRMSSAGVLYIIRALKDCESFNLMKISPLFKVKDKIAAKIDDIKFKIAIQPGESEDLSDSLHNSRSILTQFSKFAQTRLCESISNQHGCHNDDTEELIMEIKLSFPSNYPLLIEALTCLHREISEKCGNAHELTLIMARRIELVILSRLTRGEWTRLDAANFTDFEMTLDEQIKMNYPTSSFEYLLCEWGMWEGKLEEIKALPWTSRMDYFIASAESLARCRNDSVWYYGAMMMDIASDVWESMRVLSKRPNAVDRTMKIFDKIVPSTIKEVAFFRYCIIRNKRYQSYLYGRVVSGSLDFYLSSFNLKRENNRWMITNASDLMSEHIKIINMAGDLGEKFMLSSPSQSIPPSAWILETIENSGRHRFKIRKYIRYEYLAAGADVDHSTGRRSLTIDDGQTDDSIWDFICDRSGTFLQFDPQAE